MVGTTSAYIAHALSGQLGNDSEDSEDARDVDDVDDVSQHVSKIH